MKPTRDTIGQRARRAAKPRVRRALRVQSDAAHRLIHSPTGMDRLARLQSFARRSRVGLVLGLLNRPHELVTIYGGTDKGWHGYTEVYRRHIGPLRFRSNVLLEIGVGGYVLREIGGSLYFWRDYLPRSRIVGTDLHEKDVRLGPRVRFVQANQSDPADLDRLIAAVGVPNIVIDDGSHVGRDVVTTFEHLFPRMPPGSVYVIEDLHTSYWPDFGGAIPAPDVSSVGLLRRLIDSAQASDPTFVWRVNHPRPRASVKNVQAVHLYPGVAIVTKRRTTVRDRLRNVTDGPTSTAAMGRKLRAFKREATNGSD